MVFLPFQAFSFFFEFMQWFLFNFYNSAEMLDCSTKFLVIIFAGGFIWHIWTAFIIFNREGFGLQCTMKFSLVTSIMLNNLGKKTFVWILWGTEVEIQILLKGIPGSSVSSIICRWLMPGKASSQQKLAPIPMHRLLPDGPLVVELTLVKCLQSLVVNPGGNIYPCKGKKVEVFNINGDDCKNIQFFS